MNLNEKLTKKIFRICLSIMTSLIRRITDSSTHYSDEKFEIYDKLLINVFGQQENEDSIKEIWTMSILVIKQNSLQPTVWFKNSDFCWSWS